MPRKLKRVVRRRGMGLFGSIGSWLGSRAGDALGGVVGLGRKRRVRRGGSLMRPAVLHPFGTMLGARRRLRRVRRGGAIPTVLKPAATVLKNYLLSKGKDYIGNKIESMYGFGRKRRVVRRRGGRSYNRLLL